MLDSQPISAQAEARITPEDYARATLNILEDAFQEKTGLEALRKAVTNILEDSSEEKKGHEQMQRAMLNLLEDFGAERSKAQAAATELQGSLELIRVAKEATEASNRELEAFTYTVSHDLRAPLRAINSFAQLLVEEHGQELSPEAQEYLERVRHGGVQMGHLVDDLLAFSRLGRQDMSKRRVPIAEVVDLALEDLRADREGRQIDLRIRELPACEADPSLLRIVFVNLLSNAIKYSRPRERAHIDVGVLGPEEVVQVLSKQPTAFSEDVLHAKVAVFYVRDNGIGFDMQYASKLFGVFQRLHKAREFEGTGVGLATVQRIIQRHGGRVWAEAEVDKGATFYFTLAGLAGTAAELPR